MTSEAPDLLIQVLKASSYHTFTSSLPSLLQRPTERRLEHNSWRAFAILHGIHSWFAAEERAGVRSNQCWLQAQGGCRCNARMFGAAGGSY